MISKEDISGLRRSEKDAILDVILGMAWTDGHIAPAEIALLKKISVHFTREPVEKLLAEYKTDLERVGRKIATSDLGPAGRRALVKCMAYMEAASGNVTEAESNFHRQCLAAFGMTDAQRKKVEVEAKKYIYSEWVEEALTERRGELSPEARKALDEKRKGIELDDATAAKIEGEVRHDLEQAAESGGGATLAGL